MYRVLLVALFVSANFAHAEVNCLTRGHGHTIMGQLLAPENQPILANFEKVMGSSLTHKLKRMRDAHAGSLVMATAGKYRGCENSFSGFFRKSTECKNLINYRGKFVLNTNVVGELSVENNGLMKTEGSEGDNHLVYVEKLCADGKSVDLNVGNSGLKIQLRSFGSSVTAQVGYLKGSEKDLTNETTVAAFDFNASGKTPVIPNSDSTPVAEEKSEPAKEQTADSNAPGTVK